MNEPLAKPIEPQAATGMARYPHLFPSLRLGTLVLPDRFAMAPMTTNFAELDGAVTPRRRDYLAARGKGGFSLIVTENTGVHPSGRVMPRMVTADDDRHIPGPARLADAIHATGAKAIAWNSLRRVTTFCLDAHPGFRALHRRLMAEFGARMQTTAVAPRPVADQSLIAGSTTPAGRKELLESDWTYPYAAFGTADASIDDIYEPGLMTAGVYAAAELALRA